MEHLTAAVRCGADAVYLGTKNFNARRRAENFDETTLKEAAAYCRARGVKLYVTVNTVVTDSELDDVEREVDMIAASGANGIIIQDMAVLDLLLNKYPSIERLASTQTAVHNVSGARQLEDMGFDRIVLARELSLDEMEKICAAVSIGTEAFVHGAHCMSVSGMCYLSSAIGGRSGNRGMCAQPCRLNFRSGVREYALSLKDLSCISHLRDMARSGIGSFKIEGRMKRPEYVAAAVTACKRALAGEDIDTEILKRVFSRSGFTDGYLTGKHDNGMFGRRLKEDAAGTELVLKSLRSLYKSETPLVGVDMCFRLEPDSPSELSVSDGDRSVTIYGARAVSALNHPLDGRSAEDYLTRTGGTPFYVKSFVANIAPGLFLAAAELNALRRKALDALYNARADIVPAEAKNRRTNIAPAHTFSGRGELWGRFSACGRVAGADELEKIILPAYEITTDTIEKYGGKLIAELPAVLFPNDEADLVRRLGSLKNAGLREVMADNIYGVRLGKELGLSVRGGAGLNITNTAALEIYRGAGIISATVSFELSMRSIKQLGGSIPRGIVAYGRLPLMRLRLCPARPASGCSSCGGSALLTDRLGVRFPVVCDGRGFSTLLNSVPLHIADRNLDGLEYLLLYFTVEDREEISKIIGEYLTGQKSASPRTGGLYYRELL
jgi:putative protease